MLQVILWVLGTALALFGLIVKFRLAYRGSLSAYRLEYWELIGSITKEFPKLHVEYDGRGAGHGLYYIHYMLVNDGYKDIDLSERGGLQIELPTNDLWLEGSSDPTGDDPVVNVAISQQTLTVTGGLLKRGEALRIRGVIQAVINETESTKTALKFRHRFEEVAPVARRSMPSSKSIRDAVSEFTFQIATLVVATCIATYFAFVPGKSTYDEVYIDTRGNMYESVNVQDDGRFLLIDESGTKIMLTPSEILMKQFSIEGRKKPSTPMRVFLWVVAGFWLLILLLVTSEVFGPRISRLNRFALRNLELGKN